MSYYTIRAKVAEGLSLAAGAKLTVAGAFASNGALPVDNSQAGLPNPAQIASKFVKSATVANGEIDILYGNNGKLGGNPQMDGTVLKLTPDTTTNAGSIVWKCAIGDTAKYKYVPAECRN